MEQTQIVTVIQIIAGLLVALVGILGATSGGLLVALILLVRAIRSDKALITAIEKLYASVPAPVKETVKEVGEAASEVGGLIGDVSAPPTIS